MVSVQVPDDVEILEHVLFCKVVQGNAIVTEHLSFSQPIYIIFLFKVVISPLEGKVCHF